MLHWFKTFYTLMERVNDEVEKYEPELVVWPSILLAFLVPLVPFASFLIKYFVEGENVNLIFNIVEYILISLPLFISAYILRTGHKRGLLLLPFVLNLILLITFFALKMSKENVLWTLGFPIETAISLLLLSPLSFCFYSKRMRSSFWLLSLFFVLIIDSALILSLFYFSKLKGVDLIFYVIPISVLFLSFSMLFITRRSNSSPLIVNLLLFFIAVFSLFITNERPLFNYFSREIVLFFLTGILSNYAFWFTISYFFVFSSLGAKSTWKNFNQNDYVDNPYSNYVDEENFENSKEREEINYRRSREKRIERLDPRLRATNYQNWDDYDEREEKERYESMLIKERSRVREERERREYEYNLDREKREDIIKNNREFYQERSHREPLREEIYPDINDDYYERSDKYSPSFNERRYSENYDMYVQQRNRDERRDYLKNRDRYLESKEFHNRENKNIEKDKWYELLQNGLNKEE